MQRDMLLQPSAAGIPIKGYRIVILRMQETRMLQVIQLLISGAATGARRIGISYGMNFATGAVMPGPAVMAVQPSMQRDAPLKVGKSPEKTTMPPTAFSCLRRAIEEKMVNIMKTDKEESIRLLRCIAVRKLQIWIFYTPGAFKGNIAVPAGASASAPSWPIHKAG